MSDPETPDSASPVCFLSEAPETYGFARKLSAEETVALLERLIEEQRRLERSIRENLPLIQDAGLASRLAAMADAHRVQIAEMERIRRSLGGEPDPSG